MEIVVKPGSLSANQLTIKGLIVGCLIMLLLVPALFITNLVEERANRQEEVAIEVSSKWATAQTIAGPLLVIPYHDIVKSSDGKVTVYKKTAYFLPDQLDINGTVKPEIRHRSIFNIVVYNSDLKISGSFPALKFEELNLQPENILFNEARIYFGLSDFRGIEDQLNLTWDNTSLPFNAGVPDNAIITNGLSAPVAVNAESASASHQFNLQLHLRGSERLYFIPAGKTTTVHINSSWTNPSFDGNFLPVTSPEVIAKGFTADWKIQHLNRNYPQSWKDTKYDISNSAFGVKLLQPVDSYGKTKRSVKYAILFIALTFSVYFFIEILQKKYVHPVQYVLVGLALCIFYTLLLSIGEYLVFNLAYVIAASATILLITLYTKSLFAKWKTAVLFGSFLAFLYGFIFILIQLQDGALLFGSIGLFLLLAVIMYYSKKIDWRGQRNADARANLQTQ
jgi:inner membrane protein